MVQTTQVHCDSRIWSAGSARVWEVKDKLSTRGGRGPGLRCQVGEEQEQADRVDKMLLGLVLGLIKKALLMATPPYFFRKTVYIVYPRLRLFTLYHSSRTFPMARPKKAEEKPKDSGSLQISVEDFVRTRNSVSFFHFLHFCCFVATRFVHFAYTASVNNP